jgi:hypothetical protein
MPSTLGTLVSQASLKLGDTALGQLYSVSDIKQAIGDSYRYYVMWLIENGAGYFETTTDLDITANVETISLADLGPPFWKVSLIEKYVTNGRVPLVPYERRYKFLSTIGVGSGNTYIPTYKFRGLSLVLEPPPGASETDSIRLDYVYIPDFPVSSSDNSFEFEEQFPSTYEVNVVLRACVKLLEEKDVSGGLSDISSFRTELIALDKSFENTMARDEIPDDVEYVGEDYGNIYDN